MNELFYGLNPKNKPKASTFDNKYNYSEMLVEKDITLYSTCEHHFLPIVGKAHVAYISNGNVIGISKIKATEGPTVHLNEIVPESGIRISKIKNLSKPLSTHHKIKQNIRTEEKFFI